MADLFTTKTAAEALRPLSNYKGDNAFVKGQIYSMANGGDAYKYARNLNTYSKALEDSKANDNDSFWSGIGDFFVGKDLNRSKADLADAYLKASQNNPYEFDADSYNENIGKVKTNYDVEKGTLINGGLLGGIINPITQTVKAGMDLGIGATTGDWDRWNNRDKLSDLGALGQTALVLGTYGAGAGATTGATMAGTALKQGLIGAGYGLTGALNDMGSENFDAGQLAKSTALGGVLGAGIGAASHGIGNLQKAAVQNRMGDYIATGSGMSEEAKREVASLTKDILNNPADYSDDLVKSLRTDIMGSGNLLGSGQAGGDINLANVLSPSTKEMLFEELQSKLGLDSLDFMNHLGMDLKNTLSKDARPLYSQYGVAKSGIGRTLQGAGDYLSTLKNALPDSKLGKAATNLATKASNSKIGQAAGKVMSTRLGKAAAVGGGAFALGKLLGGSGANSETNYDNLSDEELQTLYNYYLTTGGQ